MQLEVQQQKTFEWSAVETRWHSDLHDEEMWIVDIETNRAEQVLHPGVVGIDTIDEVFVPATNYHLKEGRKS